MKTTTKTRSIQSTTTPKEWNGRNFNVWQRHLQRQLDKINGTQLAHRFKVN